jgi:regulator of PEP synthase PpsR (kinase-PPPase family)
VRLHLHLISDSTGETVTTVARAAVSQFEDLVAVEHVWFFVRSKPQLDKVLTIVEALPGLVVFTLVSPELRHLLQERCRLLGVPCVAVLDPVMAALTNLIGSAGPPQIGRQHAMDEGYFSRIAAMDFAMRHDDGQFVDELEDADVVLVGVSRTSKTPTCVYLANRGLKAGNVPLVPDNPQVAALEKLRRPLVVGSPSTPTRSRISGARGSGCSASRRATGLASAATTRTSGGSGRSWWSPGASSPATVGQKSTSLNVRLKRQRPPYIRWCSCDSSPS